jgi:hypothetical protein
VATAILFESSAPQKLRLPTSSGCLVKKRGWDPAFSPNIQKLFAACGSKKALLRSPVFDSNTIAGK